MLPLADHARFEMARRGISESDVQVVFEQPEQKITLANHREIWQNKLAIEGKEYVLRLVIEMLPKVRIITAYKSSKIKKYWRET